MIESFQFLSWIWKKGWKGFEHDMLCGYIAPYSTKFTSLSSTGFFFMLTALLKLKPNLLPLVSQKFPSKITNLKKMTFFSKNHPNNVSVTFKQADNMIIYRWRNVYFWSITDGILRYFHNAWVIIMSHSPLLVKIGLDILIVFVMGL